MDTVIRNVDEIDAHDRQSLEHVLGLSLRENQQLVINIVDLETPVGTGSVPATHTPPSGKPTLPEWCNVYEGLSDDEIAAVEQTILRADLSRPSE